MVALSSGGRAFQSTCMLEAGSSKLKHNFNIFLLLFQQALMCDALKHLPKSLLSL